MPVGLEAYKRKRRDAIDRLVDRELRRQARCDGARKFLVKAGLAIIAGAVPAVFAGMAGWIDRITELINAVLHGGTK